MSGEIPVLTTKRLILRAFAERDLDEWTRINDDADATRFVGGVLDRGAAWHDIALHLGHWSLRGFGNWALELRETDQLIGRAGLWQPAGWPGVELGWMIGRPWWGHGLATEASVQALEWARDVLRLREVISLIHPDDSGSLEVAGRLDMRYDRPFMYGRVEVGVYAKRLRRT
ncbi:MAG: GNAT family N-acetyltransferase [Acidimicrobiales bacterium]